MKFVIPDNLPRCGNPDIASIRLERWKDVSLRDNDLCNFAKSLTSSDDGLRFLNSIFGNSRFLSHSIEKEPEFFVNLCENGFDDSFTNIIKNLEENQDAFSNDMMIMRYLRVAKRKVSLVVALADITENWSLEKVTRTLSIFAKKCVSITVRYLLKKSHKYGEIQLKNPAKPEVGSGLLVLAMGKLGAKELNYSSDIDLIIIFEEKKLQYSGRGNLQSFFVRLTQDIVRILNDRTKDGYVFRVDLRIRPDPGSTQSAISLKAAEIYYNTLGQNWERAAMIKARRIAGDKSTWRKFLKALKSYIWRRSLDFDSIEDIHSIKRQIDSRHGKLPENLYKYNVKLGRGGIREIEFFTQTQQLIWGGRRPKLRVASTCKGLQALVDENELRQEICDELVDAYRFYRKIEHRLQMQDDNQTHTLPSTAEDMDKLALFLGYPDRELFIRELSETIARVQEHYSRLFKTSPSLASDNPNAFGNLVFTGSDNDPETLETISHMGFSDGAYISEMIRGWHHGRYHSTRSRRAREILTKLIPVILDALSKTPSPDTAMIRFNDFLSKVSAGVQIFSLFHANPATLNLIADIMGGHPYLAKNLNHTPELLDYVLAPEFYSNLPEDDELEKSLEKQLEEANNWDEIVDITKAWAHERQFRIGIQLINLTITTEEAARNLSRIAEIVIATLLGHLEKDFIRKYGKIEDSHFAVLALGKLGGYDMTFGSDLDLIFIYNTNDKHSTSDGRTSLVAAQYFARLSHCFVRAITDLSKKGRLYEIDLRLRPSGNDGPVASSLEAFTRYYSDEGEDNGKASSAWAWEYMALTKARAIAGDEDFCNHIMEIIQERICRRWDNKQLSKHILDMHKRASVEHISDNPFNIKYAPGGLMDLEYISQFLQLKFAEKHPKILSPNTRDAFKKIQKLEILEENVCIDLINAANLYINVQFILRLTGKESAVEKDISNGIWQILTKETGMKNITELKEKLLDTQKNIQKHFHNIIA